MATTREKFRSRVVEEGVNPSAELRYDIFGVADDVEARNELRSAAPAAFDLFGTGLWLLPRESLHVQRIGVNWWEGTAHYSALRLANERLSTFDTGGGVQRITQSRATVQRYAPAGQTAPNYRGAIGVTADGVEGVDIVVPVFHFSETRFPDALTNEHKGVIFSLTGRVNNNDFLGYDAGEVLFLGASGSRRGSGVWEVLYRFAASPNFENLTIGDITGIDKKGWEYLWVRYADSEDAAAKALVKKPLAVYIERVYDQGDMSLLGIG